MKSPEILKRILLQTRIRVEIAKAATDLPDFFEKAYSKRTVASPGFSSAFGDGINIIAEIKRASPSKGLFRTDVDISETASLYEGAGARAISVLTEEDFFLGSIADLAVARNAASLPILRKDFIFDEFQIFEATVYGADAVLLIVAMLDDDRLTQLMKTCEQLGLDALIEVHNEEEMRRAIGLGAGMIGVNNRDLNSFEVDLRTSERLFEIAPDSVILIAESGLNTHEDILRLSSLGYRAFLVGEALMKAERPADKLREFIGLQQNMAVLDDN